MEKNQIVGILSVTCLSLVLQGPSHCLSTKKIDDVDIDNIDDTNSTRHERNKGSAISVTPTATLSQKRIAPKKPPRSIPKIENPVQAPSSGTTSATGEEEEEEETLKEITSKQKEKYEDEHIDLTDDEENQVEAEASSAVDNVVLQALDENSGSNADFEEYKHHENAFHKRCLEGDKKRTNALLTVILNDKVPSTTSRFWSKQQLFFTTKGKALGKSVCKKIEIYTNQQEAIKGQIRVCKKNVENSLTDLTIQFNQKNKKSLVKELQKLWLEMYKEKILSKYIQKLSQIRSNKYNTKEKELSMLRTQMEKKEQKMNKYNYGKVVA